MDLLRTAREIGLFEVSQNLTAVLDNDAVKAAAGVSMPLPPADTVGNVERIADWLKSFGKSKYMFLTPEIALIERLALLDPRRKAMILVPCDMREEVRARLRGNLPKRMDTSLLEEPFFPEGFYPGNGIIVACGYLAGGRTMVLPETYRMIEHYTGGFYGKTVFIPYAELEEGIRYDGWLEVPSNRFKRIWRDGE